MTPTLLQFLNSFEALPPEDKHQALIQILRRTGSDGDLPEDALVQAAEELFRGLDEEEADHGTR